MRFGSGASVVDLFCGAGGISEGFRQTGFDALLGVDFDPNAIRTYRRHHGNGLQCGVEDLTADKIRHEIGDRQITVLTAGPPCQAFSPEKADHHQEPDEHVVQAFSPPSKVTGPAIFRDGKRR